MKSIIKFRALSVLCIVGLIFTAFTFAQKSKTGDFDIKKVHEAVKTGIADSVSRESAAFPGADTKDGKNAIGDNVMIVSLRIIGYLVFITLVIVLVIWFIKRLGLSGTSRIGGGSMDLLEALPIGQNRSLILVRVMDAVYVLTQSSQNVTLIEKIEGDKAVELIATTKGGTSIVQFRDVFNNFIGKIKKSS